MNMIKTLKNNIPSTRNRVPLHTDEAVNQKIENEMLRRLDFIGYDKNKIDARLLEIEKEWDIERAIEANASTLALIGLGLGATVF